MRPTTLPRRALCAAPVLLTMIVVMASCADDPTGAAGERAGGPHDAPAGADGGATDAPDLAVAVAASRALPHGRVELSTTVSSPSGPVTVVHRAAFTERGLRVEASSDMSQAAAALAEAGEQLDGDWSRPTRVVVDGDAVYSQLGPMAEVLGRSPDDWVRARLADVTAAGADNDAMVLALDPLGPLDLLARPVTALETVDDDFAGDDDHAGRADTAVRGVPARHLRATLDLRAAESASPTSLEARLVAAGVASLPVDVWLDADGVVRRLTVEVAGAGSMTTAFDLYDTGTGSTVEVTPPDPSTVVAVTPHRRPGDEGDTP